VHEARASLLQLARPAVRKSAETGNKGTDLEQVELLKAELQRTQEAAKAMEHRLAVLEAAKTPMPAPAPSTEPIPAAPDPAKLVRDLQRELRRVGCDPGAVDAQWGKLSQQALQKFAQHAAVALPMGEPTTVALDAVSARQDRVCPLVCDDNETEVSGTCLARPRARSRRPYASRRPERSPKTSSEHPSGGPSIGITIGVGRRGGIGVGF
jgi:D-alanyl-D-alanine dipeptidase